MDGNGIHLPIEAKPSQANKALSANIKRVFNDENARAGSPRITRRLHDEGQSASRNRVTKIMRVNGWRAKATKKYKATTNSNHTLPVASNMLEQNFEANAPDQKRMSDITTIWTAERWLYNRRARIVFPQGGRLGNDRAHGRSAGVRCA